MITSKNNALIKEIRSLRDKKFRDRLGVFVAEGVKPVKEAVELGLNIREVVGTELALGALELTGIKTETVTDAVFKSLSEAVTPQGVLAVVITPNDKPVSPRGRCVLLDGIGDPANVGAIIRTAAAAGYNDVYVTSDCADPYSQKAVRASMSGVFRVNVMRGEAEELLSVIDIPLAVADMNGKDVFSYRPENPFCLVIGNEGHGVREEIRKRAEITVSIPMEGGVESLNAAVSAGIIMYALKNKAQR